MITLMMMMMMMMIVMMQMLLGQVKVAVKVVEHSINYFHLVRQQPAPIHKTTTRPMFSLHYR